jgi:hypothetical protein
MTHFLTWRVTPTLHGDALTLDMDMVMPLRHISRVYEHYLRCRPPFEAFLTPSMRSFHIMRLDVGPLLTWDASTP